MDDETLIEYVRQHVELYDTFDKRYIDGAHKQRVWKEIAQYLGHSGKLDRLPSRFRTVPRIRTSVLRD